MESLILATNLKRCRVARKLSQQKLSEAAGTGGLCRGSPEPTGSPGLRPIVPRSGMIMRSAPDDIR